LHPALLADQTSLASGLTIVRLSLHVLAASIWVGGQFVLAGLMPTVRGLGDTAPRQVARAFAALTWPSFGVLLITGVWNYFADDPSHATTAWKTVFMVKMVCVIVAGVGVGVHMRATKPRTKGIYASVAALASIAALVLGVALAG
jgi:putative copper export protein